LSHYLTYTESHNADSSFQTIRGDEGSKDFLTPKEIQQWADREIADATKALKLRKKEVTEIARAYTAGEITPEKADEMHARYNQRWGESLPGTTVGDGLRTDEQLLAEIDKSDKPFITPRKLNEEFSRRFEGKPGGKHR
jgi:hypothetical protein